MCLCKDNYLNPTIKSWKNLDIGFPVLENPGIYMVQILEYMEKYPGKSWKVGEFQLHIWLATLTQVMPSLILMNVHYLKNVVFRFEEELNGQIHSSSDSHHLITLQRNFSFSRPFGGNFPLLHNTFCKTLLDLLSNWVLSLQTIYTKKRQTSRFFIVKLCSSIIICHQTYH